MKIRNWNLMKWLFLAVGVWSIFTTNGLASNGSERRNQIYNDASGAVVAISSTDENNLESGFIYAENGVVVTNYHVVRHAGKLQVGHLKYKRKYEEIYIVALDVIRDIAILRIKNFDGFKKKKGPVDPQGAPIARKRGVDDKDVIQVGYDILALTNPAELRILPTPGIVSGHENAAWLFPRRKGVLTADEQQYKVLLFTAKVAGGSSGGVLLRGDTDEPEAVGVVIGAVGEDEFSGFGIPIEYVNALIEQAKKSEEKPSEGFPWSEFEKKDDPYYQETLYRQERATASVRMVSGFVRTERNQRIPKARVLAIGQDGEHKSIRFAETDKEGRFEIRLSNNRALNWKVRIDHENYKRGEFGPFDKIEDFDTFYPLSVREEDVQNVHIFEALPRVIGLQMDTGEVFLRSYIVGPTWTDGKRTEWSLAEEPPEWLGLGEKEGVAAYQAKKVTLSCQGENINPNDYTDIEFVTSSTDNKDVKTAVVGVYANEKPKKASIIISGFIIFPPDLYQSNNVLVTPWIDGKQVGQSSLLEKQSRFELRIDGKYAEQTVKLKVESNFYNAPDNHPSLLVDAEKEWCTIIRLVSRNP